MKATSKEPSAALTLPPELQALRKNVEEASKLYWPARDEWIRKLLESGAQASAIARALGISSITQTAVYREWKKKAQRAKEIAAAQREFEQALRGPIKRDPRLGSGLLVEVSNLPGNRLGEREVWEIGPVAYQRMLDDWHAGGMYNLGDKPRVHMLGKLT